MYPFAIQPYGITTSYSLHLIKHQHWTALPPRRRWFGLTHVPKVVTPAFDLFDSRPALFRNASPTANDGYITYSYYGMVGIDSVLESAARADARAFMSVMNTHPVNVKSLRQFINTWNTSETYALPMLPALMYFGSSVTAWAYFFNGHLMPFGDYSDTPVRTIVLEGYPKDWMPHPLYAQGFDPRTHTPTLLSLFVPACDASMRDYYRTLVDPIYRLIKTIWPNQT